jgi:hypothetical protein
MGIIVPDVFEKIHAKDASEAQLGVGNIFSYHSEPLGLAFLLRNLSAGRKADLSDTRPSTGGTIKIR